MARVLILDKDQPFITRLYEKLTAEGHIVSFTDTVREACLMISEDLQDFVFIGEEGAAAVIQSLRTLQSDLRIILIMEKSGQIVPEDIRRQVQGVLPRNQVALVNDVISVATAQAVSPAILPNETPNARPVNGAVITATLQQALQDPQILAAICIDEESVIALAGTLNDEQAEHIAGQVWQNWQDQSAGLAQVSFVSVPGRVSEILLFAQLIDPQHLIIIAAQPDTTITPLRRTAKLLVEEVATLIAPGVVRIKNRPEPINLTDINGGEKINSYALVWRSIAPIPDVLQIPIRRALARIAQANACLLNFQDVQSTHIHLVVTCPPGRDSSWLAHRFKQGTAEEIQAQFGIKANLWQPGYVAIPSTDPLEPQDLDLFLSRPTIEPKS